MICEFCGEEFAGRPVRQGGQIFCSIGCADAAAEVGIDDDSEGYYEEEEPEFDSFDDEDF